MSLETQIVELRDKIHELESKSSYDTLSEFEQAMYKAKNDQLLELLRQQVYLWRV